MEGLIAFVIAMLSVGLIATLLWEMTDKPEPPPPSAVPLRWEDDEAICYTYQGSLSCKWKDEY